MFVSEFAIYLFLKRRPQLNSAPCDKLHSRGTTAQGAPAGMQPVHSVHKWASDTKTHLWMQALGKTVPHSKSFLASVLTLSNLNPELYTMDLYRMFSVKLTLRSSLIIQPADNHSSIIAIQCWQFSSCMDKQLWQHLQTCCPFTYISNMKLLGSGTTDLPERKSRSSHKDKESSAIMNEAALFWMRKKHRYLQSERWKSFLEQSSSFGLSLCFLRSLRQTQTPLQPCSHTVL